MSDLDPDLRARAISDAVRSASSSTSSVSALGRGVCSHTPAETVGQRLGAGSLRQRRAGAAAASNERASRADTPRMKTPRLPGLGLGLLALLALACGPKVAINETRMVQAPAREAGCPLEFVQVDIAARDFNDEWQVLGHVTLYDDEAQDPMAEPNRALVRNRACAMGGTAVAVALNATNQNLLKTGSGLSYMVLRPMPARPTPPTAF
jgi:hypothetical protein